MACSTEPCITIRKARLDDYEAVLEINKHVYDGCDYIPLYYKDLINDPDFHYYVAEVDGDVAAFEGVILLDDNKSLMARSARVKQSYKGMGLLKQMRQKIAEDFKSIATLKRYRTSCTNLVRLVDSKTFHLENKTLLKRELLAFEVMKNDLVLPADASQGEARNIDLHQFGQLLEKEPLKHFLFPEGIFTSVSWFFDALASNMKYLEKLFPHVVVSQSLFQNLKPESSIVQSDSQMNDSEFSPGLIIIGSHYFCPKSLFYYVDVFGTATEGREEDEIFALLKSHVVNVYNLVENRDDVETVIFPLSMTEGTYREFCKSALIRLGYTLSELDSKYQYQYYFEQDF